MSRRTCYAFLSRLSRTTPAGASARPPLRRSLQLLIAATVMAPLSVFAQQNTAVLGGRVLDAANGSPLAFASVVVEDAAYLGAGALVREGRRIGAGALVGMGSGVVRDVPADEVWAGSPARRLRSEQPSSTRSSPLEDRP